MRYKLQVQEDDANPQAWHDVFSAAGELLVFDEEKDARAKLAELYPVLTKMEAFAADRKRTRVVRINPYQNFDEEKED